MGHKESSPKGDTLVNSHIKKRKRAQIRHLITHPKVLQNQECSKSAGRARKELMKIREEMNETGWKQTIKRINESKSWFFERLNEIDKLLANLTKIKEKYHSNPCI